MVVDAYGHRVVVGVAVGRLKPLSASAGSDFVRRWCWCAMAEMVAGTLRCAGALSGTVQLIVALCCNHGMLGQEVGSVGMVRGWLEGCFGGGGSPGGDGARRWWRWRCHFTIKTAIKMQIFCTAAVTAIGISFLSILLLFLRVFVIILEEDGIAMASRRRWRRR